MEPDEQAEPDRAGAVVRVVLLAVAAFEVFYMLDVLTGGTSSRWFKERWYAVATPLAYRWRLDRQVRREAPHVIWEAIVAKEGP